MSVVWAIPKGIGAENVGIMLVCVVLVVYINVCVCMLYGFICDIYEYNICAVYVEYLYIYIYVCVCVFVLALMHMMLHRWVFVGILEAFVGQGLEQFAKHHEVVRGCCETDTVS